MRKCMCRRAQAHLRCAYGVTCKKNTLGVPFAFPCKKKCVGGKDWPREIGFGFLACVVCSQAILHVCLHVFCGCLIEFLYPIFQILHAQSGMQMDRFLPATLPNLLIIPPSHVCHTISCCHTSYAISNCAWDIIRQRPARSHLKMPCRIQPFRMRILSEAWHRGRPEKLWRVFSDMGSTINYRP